jgi:hypothetical protein
MSPAGHKRMPSVPQRARHLPAIPEDDDDLPAYPDKAEIRARFAAGHFGFPYPGSPGPPTYSSFSLSSIGTEPPLIDEKLPELPKDKRPVWAVRRGGWCRVVLVIFVAVVCIVVALAVGLTLGLRHSNK